ncbi:hypothetical protein LX36DRAFT_116785 [Colletotrichum falcatum]|nr:hypothetical protein LX36DRAFT_116785 [Colletotrichum falcatum]
MSLGPLWITYMQSRQTMLSNHPMGLGIQWILYDGCHSLCAVSEGRNSAYFLICSAHPDRVFGRQWPWSRPRVSRRARCSLLSNTAAQGGRAGNNPVPVSYPGPWEQDRHIRWRC